MQIFNVHFEPAPKLTQKLEKTAYNDGCRGKF